MDGVHDQDSPRGLRELIRDRCAVSFARSGGPGGQNVNKVASKVIARLPIRSLSFLDAGQRKRIATRLARRINSDGEIVVSVQDTRDQARNREIAFDRMAEMLARALEAPKPRVRTRPTAAAREARIRAKKRRAESKKLRERIDGAE